MWKWLKVSSNQKLLALLGGGFAAIVVAIWTVYTHFYPASKSDGSASNTRVVEARCGIAAGNDVLSGDVSISCGLDEDEIGLLIGEKLDNFDLQEIINNIDSSNPDVNSELSEISRSLGITEESLRSIFVKLSSSSYERESIRSSLIELIRMNTRIVLDNHADRMPPESMDGIPTKNSGNVAAIRGANIQIVGSYSVSGNNPGSTRIYRGRVNVTKKGDVFDVLLGFPRCRPSR